MAKDAIELRKYRLLQGVKLLADIRKSMPPEEYIALVNELVEAHPPYAPMLIETGYAAVTTIYGITPNGQSSKD